MQRTLLFGCLFLTAVFPSLGHAAESGWRVFVCGHSFHQFIDTPLEALAREAGHTGHRNAGKLVVGGSQTIDIWNQPDIKNTAKTALTAGQVDVLTLSPRERIPDPGIDLYADLAAKFNPAVRVFVQVSWSPKMIAMPDPAFWRERSAEYMAVLRDQARAINKRHERDYVYLVPVGPAVITLWEQIGAGKVPGVTNVQALFSDTALHASPILQNLVTYCWYAAIYGQSPAGLKALDGRVPAETNRVLQQIAWDSVSAEPLNGVPSSTPKL